MSSDDHILPDDFLNSVADATSDVLGVYSAGTYSIGLKRDVETYLNAAPFEESQPQGKYGEQQFHDYLTFLHEMSHLTHFMCTPFGFEYALSVLMAYMELQGDSPHSVPIQTSLNSPLSLALSAHEVLFRDLTPSTVAKSYQSTLSNSGFNIVCTADHVSPVIRGAKDAAAVLDLIKKSGSMVMPKTVVSKYFKEGDAWDISAVKAVECNAATLFEGFAIATEIEALVARYPGLAETERSIGEMYFRILGKRPDIYEMCWIVYKYIFELPHSFSWTMMKVLIDISLCLRPAVFPEYYKFYTKTYDLSYMVMPFDTYVRACDAARFVRPITADTFSEIARFEQEVCDQMGLPTASEMAMATLDHAEKLILQGREMAEFTSEEMNTLPPLQTVFGHLRGLRIRKANPGAFTSYFRANGSMAAFYRAFSDLINVFNLRNGVSNGFTDPSQMVSAVIGQSLSDVWREKRPIGCPLSLGKPFQCGGEAKVSLCAFRTSEGGVIPCPSRQFEDLFA